jgi:hypothetical protein
MKVKSSPPYLRLERCDANKHLVHAISESVENYAAEYDAKLILDAVVAHLTFAVALHATIAASGIVLRDETASYQAAWRAALTDLRDTRVDDFEFLQLLSQRPLHP